MGTEADGMCRQGGRDLEADAAGQAGADPALRPHLHALRLAARAARLRKAWATTGTAPVAPLCPTVRPILHASRLAARLTFRPGHMHLPGRLLCSRSAFQTCLQCWALSAWAEMPSGHSFRQCPHGCPILSLPIALPEARHWAGRPHSLVHDLHSPHEGFWAYCVCGDALGLALISQPPESKHRAQCHCEVPMSITWPLCRSVAAHGPFGGWN